MSWCISSSDYGDANPADALIVHVDMTQERELLQEVAERPACHWLGGIVPFVLYKRREPIFFVNLVGLLAKDDGITIEGYSDLVRAHLLALRWHYPEFRRRGSSRYRCKHVNALVGKE